MRLYSKYALCGSISEYNDAWAGQKNFNMILMRRITVKVRRLAWKSGFVNSDHG